MKIIHNTYEPVANFLLAALRSMNIMHDAKFAESMNEFDSDQSFLYLP